MSVNYIKTGSVEVVSQPLTENSDTSLKLALIKSKGSDFEDALLGRKAENALKLLLTAVNNRTVERDFFRLYCDYLDGSITEEEYNRQLEEHGSDYIVSEDVIPSDETLELALRLAKKIKGVESIEDFTSLFSFDGAKVRQIAAL